MSLGESGLPDVNQRDGKAFITEGPDDAKQVQFFDTPKARRPAPPNKLQDKYVAPASSASQTTTKLLQKRRKNTEWQQSLELKREEFAKRMADCDSRQSMLKKKCKELRKRVQTQEQQVQETRSKIERATKKQEEEKLFQEQKDQEIAEKKTQVDIEEEEHTKLRQQLETRNQYKAFLDRVCDENEGNPMFDEVDSILQKHASLMDASKNLADNNCSDQQSIEDMKEKLARNSKMSVTQVVERNARISEGRAFLERLRVQTSNQAAQAVTRKQEEQERIKELGEIEMAVENLYARCFQQGKQTKASAQEAEKLAVMTDDERILAMLSRLSTYFIDMEQISKKSHDHPKKPQQVVQSHQVRSKRTTTEAKSINNGQANTSNDSSYPVQRRGSQSDGTRHGALSAQIQAL